MANKLKNKQLKVGKNKHIFAIRRILQLNDECRSKYREVIQWKRISRKQSARWQHLSQLKGGDIFSLQTFFSC